MTNFYWKLFNNRLKYEDNKLDILSSQFDSKYSIKYKQLYKQVMTHNGVTNDGQNRRTKETIRRR